MKIHDESSHEKIHDESSDEYLQGQQVIMELCIDIHTLSSQELLPKMFLASCFLALVSALMILKVVVFGHCNSEEREGQFHISRFGTSPTQSYRIGGICVRARIS